MLKDFLKDYIYPAAVFCGGIVGVGFLSLPYVAKQVGIWPMLIYFAIMTGLIVFLNMIFCQISLQTPDYKRFPGFVGHYLGKWPKALAMLSVVLGTLGVLLVYLLVGGQFLTSVFQPVFSGHFLFYVLIYFALASTIVFFDIKIVARAEFWIIVLLFLALLFIFIEAFPQVSLDNILNLKLKTANLFLPYGTLLFALWGVGLIPEVEEMIRGKKKRLFSIIAISTVVVAIFYLLFTFLVLGISGSQTDQTALTSLKNFLGGNLTSVALLIGALATFTAFITHGIILKKTLIFDLGIKHWQAFIMTCATPLILLLLGLNSFVSIISLIGGVLLGLDGIFILLMYKKIGGPKVFIYPLSIVFLLGIVYEIIYSCLPAGRL